MRCAERGGVKFLREVRFAAERAFRPACGAPSSAASGTFHAASGTFYAASGDGRVGVSGPARANALHGASERSAGNRSVGLFRIARRAACHLDSGDALRRVFLIFIIGCVRRAVHRTIPFDS